MKKMNILHDLRSFLLLWGSQTVSALGTAMTEYAVIVWVYGQEGSASSVTLLTICSFAPTILFRFAAGALADRWDKKRVMLTADLFAACGTAAVLALHASGALRVWHLYVINVLLSFMNAFQVPASFVATSLLTPREHYARVSGLQSFSGAAVSILAPALGGFLVAWRGLDVVLAADLATFAVAFLVLLCCIRIPPVPRREEQAKEPFRKTCLDGIRALRNNSALLRLTLFMTGVNFLAKLGNDGMISPFVLGRTGNDPTALGAVQSSVAIGLLLGSALVTVMKPVKDKPRLICLTCAAIFSGGIVQSLSIRPWVWCLAAVGSYLTAAVMGANLDAFLREQVPLEMQGRVFSAKDTLQNCAIPLGLYLGGVLADHVFEPLMASDPPQPLSALFGSGTGAGIAVMFFIAGVLGILLSLTVLRRPGGKAKES